jgi:hypothetical protein
VQLLVERVVVRLGGLEIPRSGCGCSELAVRPGKCGGVKAKTLPDAAAAGGVEIPAN